MIGLREGKYTAEVAAILVDNIKLMVASGEFTYGYLETTEDEMDLFVAQAKPKVISVNRV